MAARRLSRAVSASGPPRNRAASSAWCSSSTIRPDSLDADPSTPSPTGTPASSRSRIRAMPDPSRALDVGQCATPVPVAANRAIAASERCTQWASHTSSPSQPRSSAYSTGVAPNVSRQNSSSSRVSARCVCIRTPARRASAAESRISSAVTENGEQGATAIRTIASGDGSCQRAMAASVAARIASWSSTTESGGSPPGRCAEVHRAAGRVEPQPHLAAPP